MLTYLCLFGIVLGAITLAVSSVVNRYLLNQRVQEQIRNASILSAQVGNYLAQQDAAELYAIGTRAYEDGGGRVLVLDAAGIVQSDSFSEYNGYLLSFAEIDEVIYNGASSAYGFHRIYQDNGSSFWSVYCTSAVIRDGGLIGVVLYVVSIQDVIDTSESMQKQMAWIYGIGIIVVVVATSVLTRVVTRPVQQLTDVALRISAGDLASRAQVRGHNEIAELARTFNMMCDRLQNMDEQRSEFVSDASHELKTPLASMKILVESLLYQDDVPEEVYKDFLADIDAEIDRLSHLITDLLLLSKMDTDQAALNLEPVDLSALVTECVDSLKPIAKAGRVTIDAQVPSGLEAECDSLKMRQALNNLIENAIKYSQEGGHVYVTGGREGGEVFISVEDDGVGMREEYLPHIFERFYRVDKARSRETGGTGLGLHIVRRIAVMHGGRVDVESREGIGSRFTLIIPAVHKARDGALGFPARPME